MILTVFPDPRGNSLPQDDRACPANCAQCPFAKDHDLGMGRLHCTHNDQVVRQHWEPTGDCLEAIAKHQAREMQAPQPAPQPQPIPKATEEEWEQRMREFNAAYLEQCQQQGLWRDLKTATGGEELIEAMAAEEVPEQGQSDRSLQAEETAERTLAQLEALYERVEAIVESVAIAIACTPQRKRAIACTSVIPLQRRPKRRQLRPTRHKPKQWRKAPTPRTPRTHRKTKRSLPTANCELRTANCFLVPGIDLWKCLCSRRNSAVYNSSQSLRA